MSLIFTLLGFIAFLWLYLLLRLVEKKQWIAFCLLVALSLAGLAFIFRPVCVPIENGEQKNAEYNYEQREDKNFHVRVFQKKNGRWRHCKTWIARQFFF